MGRTVGGGRLRARLLVGVAAAAMAAPATKALRRDAAKWSPYVEAGGMVGTHSFGDVDIFIPVWQDQTSLLFGDLRGTFSAQPTEEGNFGLGYRTQINPDWILGGYGYFDIQNSANDNLFYQVTLGVELKSVDWDFRLNGYIPINPDGGIIEQRQQPRISRSAATRSRCRRRARREGALRLRRRGRLAGSGLPGRWRHRRPALCRRLLLHRTATSTRSPARGAGSRRGSTTSTSWGCSRG